MAPFVPIVQEYGTIEPSFKLSYLKIDETAASPLAE
jgi:hypothetical protein